MSDIKQKISILEELVAYLKEPNFKGKYVKTVRYDDVGVSVNAGEDTIDIGFECQDIYRRIRLNVKNANEFIGLLQNGVKELGEK
jgi:hypothetical protein